ncbi:alpha/beta fold hydrolase [Glycomyces paridis]|uniref:Alpha/beta fold hydrolase n=1 Tax=Glycomyces paridis TaxID=2126555 RepID=A0A4S8P848_9ACTN|nr:alpha/beta fold hydrolase [Glycomyces paridis]THV26413.1 alpha/beta fold hydrolase [Glycomyces paridis]
MNPEPRPNTRRWPRRTAISAATALALLAAFVLGAAYLWRPSASDYDSVYLDQVATRYADTDLARFHYTVTGSGSPIVLIAGGALWQYSWRNTIPALAEHHTVYAVDLPGQGYTEVLQEDFAYDLPAMADAIETFLDAVGLDKTALVGHSWGGAWSLYFAETRPDRVTRLALLDAPALDVEHADQIKPFEIPILGSAVANLTTRDLFADSLKSAFVHDDRVTDEMVDETWAWFSRPGQRDAFVALAHGMDYRLTDALLHQVSAPALVLWGGDDEWLPAAQAQDLAGRLPHADAVILEGCGHNVHEDCPELAIPLIDEYFED